MKTAIYAGTFDPPTFGHLNIILRASELCDKLMVVVGVNPAKKTMFTALERELLIEDYLKMIGPNHAAKIKVFSFNGLIVDCAKKFGATLLIRGVRSSTDFEFENQLAQLNKTLAKDIETILLPTEQSLSLISSSAVKELARFNAPIDNMVSNYVANEIHKKLSNQG